MVQEHYIREMKVTGSKSEIVTTFPFHHSKAFVEKLFQFSKLLALVFLLDTLSYVILYNSIILYAS